MHTIIPALCCTETVPYIAIVLSMDSTGTFYSASHTCQSGNSATPKPADADTGQAKTQVIDIRALLGPYRLRVLVFGVVLQIEREQRLDGCRGYVHNIRVLDGCRAHSLAACRNKHTKTPPCASIRLSIADVHQMSPRIPEIISVATPLDFCARSVITCATRRNTAYQTLYHHTSITMPPHIHHHETAHPPPCHRTSASMLPHVPSQSASRPS